MDSVLQLSRQLIEIPSTQDSPEALKDALNVAKGVLKEFAYKSFTKNKIPSLLFYNTNKLPKRFKILLNAHVDVVPAKKEQFIPKEKNGRLYGRGTYDMKAAGAAMILLFKELANTLSYPLGLQLVTDEESGGFYGTKHQIERGMRADFVIAGEPTDLGINNEAKGISWAKVKTKGKSAHGAYPWNGDNAIWKMKTFLDNIEREFPVPKKEIWQTTVNLAKIETSNQTFNKVPDDCRISLDIRYIPKDAKTVINRIENLLPEDARVEIIMKEPAQYTDAKNPYILSLQKITKKIAGKISPVIVKHGSSDIRHFNQAGCDGITFGPVGAGHHGNNEWVSIKSVEDYYQILKTFLTLKRYQ